MKSLKKYKWITLICIILLCIIVFIALPSKKYSNESFGIETYRSSMDKDSDGIDDQTNVLEETKKYIATKPKYKSKYYDGGYPDDEYGVCTDVVAFALLNSGYNLQELVNEDVKNNPSKYNIEYRDKNIDFRRVSNLDVYFSNHAIVLTTDIYDIKQWQGGDIIVFKKHIGIVSNNRNKKGIPFLIHHANPFQIYYEEDVIEKMKNDIIGHYRIS